MLTPTPPVIGPNITPSLDLWAAFLAFITGGGVLKLIELVSESLRKRQEAHNQTEKEQHAIQREDESASVEALTRSLNTLQTMYQTMATWLEKLQTDYNDAQCVIVTLRLELGRQQSENAALSVRLDQLQAAQADALTTIDHLRTNLADIQRNYTALQEHARTLEGLLRKQEN